jgi:dihydroxyacetone kinase
VQKLLNDPAAFVDEATAGILRAHPEALRLAAERAIVRADAPVHGKVAIATGGGSGHLPLFLGYVGSGLADGAAIGNVFSSPSAEQMLSVTREINGGAGVLYLYGNYGGDVMNFDLAAELAAAEGIEVTTILGTDDVASAPRGEESRRRGVAGIVFLYKVAGARAAEGGSLVEVAAVTRRAAANVRTMGVGLAPCIIPAAGSPTFELDAGEMEIGIGIHGEPGIRRGGLEPADRVADYLVTALLADLPFRPGDEVAVLVNGLGATPEEELYILYRRVDELLRESDVTVHRVWVGEFATSLEMAGASLSLLRLDEELKRLIDAPARSPFFVQA